MDPDFIRSFQENLKCQYSSLESAEKSAEIQNAIFYKLVGLFEQLKTRCDELEKTVASLTSPENSGSNMNVKKLKENAKLAKPYTSTSDLVGSEMRTRAQDRLKKFRNQNP